jgi:hypothetical protein
VRDALARGGWIVEGLHITLPAGTDVYLLSYWRGCSTPAPWARHGFYTRALLRPPESAARHRVPSHSSHVQKSHRAGVVSHIKLKKGLQEVGHHVAQSA